MEEPPRLDTHKQHGKPAHYVTFNQDSDASARKAGHSYIRHGAQIRQFSAGAYQPSPRRTTHPLRAQEHTNNNHRKTGPGEELTINKPHDTGLPQLHEHAQPPQGDSMRPHPTTAQAGTQA